MTRTRLGRRATSKLVGVRVASRWTQPAPPIALVTQLRVPATFVHGTDDRFIAVRDAAELWQATPEPRRLTIVRGMGHAFEPAALDAVRAGVEWALAYELTATS
jgi:fermentation-respiration switch protein FrsA (DUF1100 family)